MDDRNQNLIDLLDDVMPRYVRALRNAISDAEGPDRLTMQQLRCLQSIAADAAGSTTTRLAEAMRVSVPTMSSMLDGLASRSLVARQVDPENRRRIPVVITAEGSALLDRYQVIMDERHLEIIDRLTPAERAIVIAAMELLGSSLDRVELRPVVAKA